VTGTQIKSPALPRAALRDSSERGVRRPKPRPLVLAEYSAAMALLRLLRALPLTAAYGLAEAFGRSLYALPRFRRRSLANLEIAFGDRPAAWRRALLRRSVPYQSWSFADIALAPRLMLDPRRADAVELSELERVLVAERGRGQGVLLVGSHQGTFEVASLAAARRGFEHAIVARVFDNPLLWEAMLAERAPFPREVLSKAGALRPAYRRLSSGGVVGIQIDQDARAGGVFVPYFGLAASTHAGAGTLAVVGGVPVYMVTCLRTAPRRFRYKVHCRGPLRAERSGDQQRDVVAITARMTAEVEVMAREFPEQVFWVHRRWKTRPEDEGGVYAADGRA